MAIQELFISRRFDFLNSALTDKNLITLARQAGAQRNAVSTPALTQLQAALTFKQAALERVSQSFVIDIADQLARASLISSCGARTPGKTSSRRSGRSVISAGGVHRLRR